MVGPTAQLVALACHFNARARGVPAEAFFPSNSTCTFCEHIHFIRRRASWLGGSTSWRIDAPTPDDWLNREARPGRSAFLVHQPVEDPRLSDRMSAGFVGGGGRWLLGTTNGRSRDAWEPGWEVGDRAAPDRRIWRVSYAQIAEGDGPSAPPARPLDALREELHQVLGEILGFAERNGVEGFPDSFRRALACLSAEDPFERVFHKDLAPAGVLNLAARQLLAACQAASVFGGMGSWNDMGFQGEAQREYERVSENLFALLNDCICAGANASAGDG